MCCNSPCHSVRPVTTDPPPSLHPLRRLTANRGLGDVIPEPDSNLRRPSLRMKRRADAHCRTSALIRPTDLHDRRVGRLDSECVVISEIVELAILELSPDDETLNGILPYEIDLVRIHEETPDRWHGLAAERDRRRCEKHHR